jgi:hypothetical protein
MCRHTLASFLHTTGVWTYTSLNLTLPLTLYAHTHTLPVILCMILSRAHEILSLLFTGSVFLKCEVGIFFSYGVFYVHNNQQ